MTFREFWPLYLQAHSQPMTRAVHYAATLVGVGGALASALTLQPAFLVGIGIAYGIAIGAHVLIEKNQSMIRVNPVWGAIADLRMFWLAATGGLQRELERCRATRQSRSLPARGKASSPAT
ncbi:Mpo1-like protein [Dongia sp.]|uniref:Mpo1-like protein n=1 Tax=Dongia sp. TaxID=1977262 RepID=UPI003750C658